MCRYRSKYSMREPYMGMFFSQQVESMLVTMSDPKPIGATPDTAQTIEIQENIHSLQK